MSLITPDFGLLFWMSVIFLIVFFILAKFGFPMITGMVDKRAERINESISKAKEAEEKLAGLAEEQQKLLAETRAEQARIIKEASDARDAIIADAKKQAGEQTRQMIDAAKEEIRIQKQTAVNEARKEVALLSVSVAEKILRANLDDSEKQEKLLEKLVKEASESARN